MSAGYVDPGSRQHPSAYEPAHLRQLLVEDAVRSHATELRWMTYALIRLSEASGKGLEETFTSIVLEVETLTGRREMPLHSGGIL